MTHTAGAGRPRTGATFLVLCLGILSYALSQSLVSPVLPTIQHHLHTSQSTVTWVMTAYLLSASVATPVLGKIGDVVGKERMLLVALLALGAGSLLAALASSIGVMIAARVIQGVGGGVLPLVFGIIRDEFPRDRVSGAIGTAAALMGVGGGLGIVVAGPIVNTLDYRWLFWLPLIVIAVAAVATHLFVPESPVRAPGRINLPAAALLSAWLVALLVPISEGSRWGWTSGRVLGLLALAVLLAAAWIAVELRSAEPLIDMRMMRLPAVWTTNLVALLFGLGLYSLMAFLPAFVQTPPSAGYGFGASVTASGVFLLPMTVTMFFSGLAAGRLGLRFGARAVLALGAVLLIPSMVLLATAHAERWTIYLVAALCGAGIGFAFSALSALIVTAVPPAQTGAASGMNANIRTIGGSIGTAVTGSIITSGAVGGLPRESGYTHGFWFLAGAAAVALATTLLVPKARRATVAEPVREAGTLVPAADN
ncbi:Multidrug resistance protein 3 [Actinomadura rubteroloni]|uniref:Multidrug resistance protein 3 n=1 Tax=Actinomadura rubteroloni TaxID=1926885 RepID=A0A2P4URN0_9ACTN|nr:MFS transporter [Actinomadura rubteroloni]POM27698.1 Multidrug resistance protein 3 [Actinomadura rubteroloni]